MNFNLEKKFPNLVSKQEGRKLGQSETDFLRSLGKKAVPYIAALTALLSSPTLLKAQDKLKSETAVEYKLTSPDGKQTKIFNTKEERDAFARAHNLNIPGDKSYTLPSKDTAPASVTNNPDAKVEYKITSPDGKQTKIFNTKEERDEFARQHHIRLPGVAGQTAPTNSNTANYQDFIKKIPPGKSTVVAIDSNNDAKIYKAKKEEGKIKLKEKGNVTIIRTQE
jgi:hypothetical protein